MTEQEVVKIFNRLSAIIEHGHFVTTQGNHTDTYINKDILYSYPEEISRLCETLVHKFRHDQIDVVVAPAMGGIVLSQWIAYHRGKFTSQYPRTIYAEKAGQDNRFVIKRGYSELISNKQVLVVEDVLSTGSSVKQVVELVRQCQGTVVGVGALWNRGNISVYDIGNVPTLVALVNKEFTMWSKADCVLCAQGKPINTEIGKGGK